MHNIGHRLNDALRRVLPVFAVVAALAGGLPPTAAGPAGAAQHAPALDVADSSNRAAVQPKLPRKAEAAAEKRVAPPLHSSPDPGLAATDYVPPPVIGQPDRPARFTRLHLPRLKAVLAQPRAPPLSSILTPAA